MPLHLKIEDLLSATSVEYERIEFKAGWNPDTVYRSICAFANDFDITSGGYILISVKEQDGRAKRPAEGLSTAEITSIRKKMIGFNNRLNHHY